MQRGQLRGARSLLAPLLILTAASSLQAQQPRFETGSRTQQRVLADAMRQNSYPLSLQDGVLRGPGFDFLARRSANAQFVVVGEEHFVKEIPEFLSALFAFLHEKHGFNYLALENDPVSAHLASLPPLRGDLQALGRYAQQYPNAFTFPTDQELRLIADAGRWSQGKIDPVWGLDQSFGVLHALDRLQALPGFRDTPMFQQLHQEALAADTRRPPSGDHPDQLDYMQSVKLADLEELRRQIDAPEGSEARFILDNLVASSQIYGYYLRSEAGELTRYANGFEREQMMKRLFMRQYHAAEAHGEHNPKVLLKFGGWHVFRGLGPSQLQTLGNFVTELATANGTDGLTVGVYLRGSWRDIGKQKGMEPIAAATDPSSWTVVDFAALRPAIRAEKFGALDPTLLSHISGFDVALVIGGASEATESLRSQPKPSPPKP
ncbi:MAG TPA: hypothetical protein VEJ00_01925 [Candidatus Acidoferrales bacterium]|nr:hypothetical protein [Candidatus Acidoferrales bacterium]